MASKESRPAAPGEGAGADLRVGVVRSAWNTEIVSRLADGVARGLDHAGVADRVDVAVPGGLELPFAAKVLAESGQVDAIVAIGTVIRGETTHYELVSQGCLRGLQDVQMCTGVPVGFGVLTVESTDQAMQRSLGPGEHNVGEDAAFVAVELALLVRRFAS